MNRQSKNGIEWCDYTWNPVTGCLHGCDYCYARRMANRFGGASETHHNETVGNECQWYTEETKETHDLLEPIYDVDRGHNASYPFYFDPTFHRYRLNEPQKVKKPAKIFVVSMGDLFGDFMPDSWIEEVFRACEAAPWHKYLFLTKNPKRYGAATVQYWQIFEHKKTSQHWFGVTIENQHKYETRGRDTKAFSWMNLFLSLEPLQSEITFQPFTLSAIKWVIIGAQTGPGAVQPEPEWVQSIIEQCRDAGVPVFVKSPLYKKFPVQEWPEGLGVEKQC